MGNDSGAPQPGFDHWEGFKGQGEYYNPRINTNGEWIQYKDSTYVTDLLTDHAIQFMKEQKQADKPFFVYLSHKGVHDNFSAAKRHKDCYKNKELVLIRLIMALKSCRLLIRKQERLRLEKSIMEKKWLRIG